MTSENETTQAITALNEAVARTAIACGKDSPLMVIAFTRFTGAVKNFHEQSKRLLEMAAAKVEDGSAKPEHAQALIKLDIRTRNFITQIINEHCDGFKPGETSPVDIQKLSCAIVAPQSGLMFMQRSFEKDPEDFYTTFLANGYDRFFNPSPSKGDESIGFGA